MRKVSPSHQIHQITHLTDTQSTEQSKRSKNLHKMTQGKKIGKLKEFTVLNKVVCCSFKDLPKIARNSEVHPKKPFHSLYIY
jgi:hypothetical protein